MSQSPALHNQPTVARDTVRIGLIGLDTSHVEAFSRLLNDEGGTHHVRGGRVVAAFPGGSPDLAISRDRVGGFTAKVRDDYDVEILGSPEEVAESVDLIFIESVDGRVHRGLFERIARFGKPTFIDKPMATTLADAEAILATAEAHGVPLMSCSSLRYAENFRAALADEQHGALVGVSTHGPMAIEPTQPGYLWYGIHCIEVLVAALGVGCRRVRVFRNERTDVLIAEWADGRVATFSGLRQAHVRFGVTLHRERSATAVDISAVTRPNYAMLLEAILRSLPHGRSDVPAGEMLEVMRVIDAANRSRETGDEVELSPLP